MQVDAVHVISAEHLSFRYNASEVLTDVSFAVRAGEYLGIVGPNGSGKTTLVKVVLGVHEPTAGRVRLFGTDVAGFRDWRRVGYVPQRLAAFNPHFPATVREVVALGLLGGKSFPRRLTRADDQAIERALELMDIGPIQRKLIGELSGGQQQRVLIGRALVGGPDLLILDEPTAAVDPEGRESFYATLTRLNEEQQIAIVIVTHDIGTIGKYASSLLYIDRTVVFHGGFEDFCLSADMGNYFGTFSQHIICHRHDREGA